MVITLRGAGVSQVAETEQDRAQQQHLAGLRAILEASVFRQRQHEGHLQARHTSTIMTMTEENQAASHHAAIAKRDIGHMQQMVTNLR